MENTHWCPKCEQAVASRDLRTSIQLVGRCRVCKTVIEVTDSPPPGENEAFAFMDVGVIDAWLDDLQSPRKLSIVRAEPSASGSYYWKIVAPPREWPFGLRYESRFPRSFELFTVCATKAKEIIDNIDPFVDTCAAHGLQVFAMTNSGSLMTATHLAESHDVAVVGAKVALKTETLPIALFDALAERLEATTREALLRY